MEGQGVRARRLVGCVLCVSHVCMCLVETRLIPLYRLYRLLGCVVCSVCVCVACLCASCSVLCVYAPYSEDSKVTMSQCPTPL